MAAELNVIDEQVFMDSEFKMSFQHRETSHYELSS